MKEKIKNNIGLIVIIFISIVVHIASLVYLGIEYNLNSDDLSYIISGIEFLKTGTITMHGYVSAQIMPGMTFLIASVSLLFGEGYKLYLALKILWLIMSIFSMIGVYKIINLYAKKIFAVIGTSFLLCIDFIWMDNLILTETPFMFCFIWMIYYSIRLVENGLWKNFYFLMIFYILSIMFKANIAIYPIFLFIYMLIKKYNFKLIIKQGLIGALIVICVLTPWAIRNYLQFGKFIPLTYGIGNPLLLGTYQSNNSPSDEVLDYKTNVENKMSEEMRYYLSDKVEKYNKMTGYYSSKADEMKAKYRMKYWWNTDKVSMLKNYLIGKPIILIYNSFYWKEVFNIPISWNLLIRKIDIVLFAFSIIMILLNKKNWKEMIFLLIVYGGQILLYSYTFAFDRYGQTLYFIRFIIIGIGLQALFDLLKRKEIIKNEVLN